MAGGEIGGVCVECWRRTIAYVDLECGVNDVG
jgi:hypothetical protein